MSLWGNADSKTASGTVVISSGGAVTGTGTSFTTQARVGNYIRVSGEDYLIKSIASNTSATVIAGVNGGTLSAVGSTTAYTLSEKPLYVTTAEASNSNGTQGDPTKVYGVDVGEAEVIGKTHSGWVRRIAGSGGRSGRVVYETLVASGTITGDQSDDSQFADLAVTIGTNPSNSSVTAPASATFTVAATNNGGQGMTYLWYRDTGSGFTALTAANEPVYTGYNTPTLTISPTSVGQDGYLFRCVVTTANGVATATSNSATLSVA